MFFHQYNSLKKAVKISFSVINLKNNVKISTDEFDKFIHKLLTLEDLKTPNHIYSRYGFSFIHNIDGNTFQLLSFQINQFGAGIFGDEQVRYCTPILLTVTAHGKHHHLEHNLKDACVTIDEFYLGRNYTGSKGIYCNWDKFNEYARTLFLSKSNVYSFNHHIVYHLMNANYLCHHIAETMGYAFGGLDLYWSADKNNMYLASASRFNESQSRLFIEVNDNFSGEVMKGKFQIPHYAKLINNIDKFKEEYDNLFCSINYRRQTEYFYLPIGYQKITDNQSHNKINVITSQHILEHLLSEYYHRKNIFVVANTFQTLEYLSRAFIAKMENRDREFNRYMKTVTCCMGYYPERNFNEFIELRELKFPHFASEYKHRMFFKAPILK